MSVDEALGASVEAAVAAAAAAAAATVAVGVEVKGGVVAVDTATRAEIATAASAAWVRVDEVLAPGAMPT